MWLAIKLFFSGGLGKWIIRLLPLFALIGVAYWWHDSRVDAAYNSGVQVERNIWNERVRVENETNRKNEQILKKIIQDGIGQRYVTESNKRDVRESKIERDLLKFMEQNTIYRDCKVDDFVLEERNKIREEGPK